MNDDLISRSALLEKRFKMHSNFLGSVPVVTVKDIEEAPAVDAVEVNHAELRHLINDTISYIWQLEDRGCATPEHGYDSRKTLLEKLKQFEAEHFPENDCCG